MPARCVSLSTPGRGFVNDVLDTGVEAVPADRKWTWSVSRLQHAPVSGGCSACGVSKAGNPCGTRVICSRFRVQRRARCQCRPESLVVGTRDLGFGHHRPHPILTVELEERTTDPLWRCGPQDGHRITGCMRGGGFLRARRTCHFGGPVRDGSIRPSDGEGRSPRRTSPARARWCG